MFTNSRHTYFLRNLMKHIEKNANMLYYMEKG